MWKRIKNLFAKIPPIKKEVGGFEILDGIVIGASYFSTDGKKTSALICPPIWAFNYSLTNVLNRLPQQDVKPEEFQSTFNSLMDDLVAEILVYLENRLKIIVIKDKLKYKMNSVPESIKAYKNLADIDLTSLCDIAFLKALDRTRGETHHTQRRYGTDYRIGEIPYDTVEKLRDLSKKVRKDLQDLDAHLALTHGDYKVEIKRLPHAVQVEWTAIKHALDMTDGGKIVPQRSTQGLDNRQIKYFAIKANYK